MKLAFFLLAIFAVVGTWDYADNIEREALEKELRVLRASQSAMTMPRPQRCPGTWIATQADGGKWRVHCLKGKTT